MKRAAILALALAAAGCGGAPPTIEDRALEPLGDRADLFRDARGLQGADRDAFFWLLYRSARRHTVDAQEGSSLDALTITPEFLERRIAQARDAQAYPWAPREEDAWRRGILMYRVGTETLSNWHSWWRQDAAVGERVEALAKAWATDPDGTLKALLHYLNAEVLGARAKKKPRGLPDLDPETCLKEGGGRGTDLAIAAITLFRSWGVPAVLVRCPLVSGEAAGDAWVGIPGTDIWMKPADPEPASPAYFAWRRGDARMPKVFICDDRNDFPNLVIHRDRLPFKSQYAFVLQPAADASAALPAAAPVRLEAMPDPSFLSMFTGSGWIEVAPGRHQEDGSADFGLCATGLLYLPTLPGPLGVQSPAGPPFVLRADGSRESFAGDTPDAEWCWTPPADAPTAIPHFWKNGAFVPARLADRDGKRFATAPSNALWLFWRAGPENGGKGKPVGRPFEVHGGIVKEF